MICTRFAVNSQGPLVAGDDRTRAPEASVTAGEAGVAGTAPPALSSEATLHATAWDHVAPGGPARRKAAPPATEAGLGLWSSLWPSRAPRDPAG